MRGESSVYRSNGFVMPQLTLSDFDPYPDADRDPPQIIFNAWLVGEPGSQGRKLMSSSKPSPSFEETDPRSND